MMKKSIAILMLGLYLFSTTEAHQLLKLPILVQHFFQHKTENGDTTFLSFLKMHYSDKVVYDDDYATDMQLPFKAHHDNFCITATPSLPTPKFEVEIVLFPITEAAIPIKNDSQYLFIPNNDFFQPPRLA